MAQQRMRTHTDYDYERLLELKRVIGRALTRKRTARQRTANLLLGLFALVVAGALVVFEKHWFFVLLLAGIALYFIAWSVFYYPLSALTTLRALDAKTASCDFFLEKSYLLAATARDGVQYRYDTCLRLFETEGNLYFIMEDGQGLILDKTNLKGGTADQLRAWMEEKTGKKTEWMGKGSAPDTSR